MWVFPSNIKRQNASANPGERPWLLGRCRKGEGVGKLFKIDLFCSIVSTTPDPILGTSLRFFIRFGFTSAPFKKHLSAI